MIRFLFILLILIKYQSNANSADWIYTASGIIHKSGYILPSGNKFEILTGTYQWTDNLGNYGTSSCKGLVENDKRGVSLNVLCEAIDQNKFKFYALYKRNSSDLSSGAGKKIFVEATGPYKLLVGNECNYAITYLENVAFSNEKCVLDDKVIRELKN